MEEPISPRRISSPTIGNNYILKNIKNAENIESHLEAQQIQKHLSTLKKISLTEFIRFITFFILFFLIVSLQIPLNDIYAQNKQMITQVLNSTDHTNILITKKSYDIYRNFEIYIPSLISKLSKPYYYYVDSPLNQSNAKISVNNTFTPITNIRVREKRVKTINNMSLEWDYPFIYETEPFGKLSFRYYDNMSCYAIFPTFFTYNMSYGWFENNLDEAGMQYDYFKYMGFYDEKTVEVSLDVTVLNTASDIVTYIEVDYVFWPTGLLSKSINLISYQFTFYESSIDKLRMIFEFIYLGIFVYYFFSQTSELYFEIKKAPVYENNQKDWKSLKFVMKFYYFLKKTIKKIFFGTKNYLADIWNFLDMLIILLSLLGIILWLNFNIHTSPKQVIEDVNYRDLSDETIWSLNRVNYFFELDAKSIIIYYFVVSKMALVLTLKLLKYIITFSQKFSNLLRIIMNIFDTIIFFLILLVFCFLAFMYLYYFYLGTQYAIFEDYFSASVFIFGIIIGASKRFTKEEQENSQFTTFFYLFFSFAIIFILINMFLVIVKNELTKLEKARQLEKNKLKKLVDKYEYTPSIFWRVKENMQSFYMKILFYFNNKKYYKLLLQKENFQRLLQNELNLNPNLDFDIKYLDIENIYRNIMENEYTIEGEKQKYMNFFKKKTVKDIWFIIFLGCLLVINIYVFVVLFNSSQNYEATSSILQRIDNSADSYQSQKYTLGTTDSKLLSIIYFAKVMPLYFTANYLYFPSVQISSNTTQSNTTDSNFSNYTTNTTENQTAYFNISENSTYANLINYTTNYLLGYNFLSENSVRLTIRKRKLILDQNNFYYEKFNQTPMSDSFWYGESSNENEDTSDFYSPSLNRTLIYAQENSFMEKGGYTFFFSPDVKETFNLIISLYNDQFLNEQINSFVLDFVLINPLSNNDLTYVKIIFEFDNSGNLVIEKDITTLSRNRMKTSNEKMIVALLITIGVCFFIFAVLLVKSIKTTLNGYESWYCLFIRNSFPQAMIYHRERKKPEILRKLRVLFSVKLVIECFFVLFNSLFYAFYVIYMIYVLSLESNVVLLGIPLEDIDNFTYKNINPLNYKTDSKERLAKILGEIEGIVFLKEMAALFSSFTVFCLSFELIFYLCKNSRFQQLLLSILKSLKDIPYVFLLFVSLILAFSVSGFFFHGQYMNGYKTVLISCTTLLQYIYRLDDMDFLMSPSFLSITLFITIILPYIFIVKFLVLNLFLAIIYRCYEDSSFLSSEKQSFHIKIRDFFTITKSFFVKQEEDENNSKNSAIYLQTINKNNFDAVFDKFRDSIEASNRNTSLHIWANICAEEIKKEQEARTILKSKCDEISQEYFLNTFKGNLSTFKENKNYDKKLVEYQLRHKYWSYLYTGHMKLINYYQFFVNKMAFLNSKLNMDEMINEQKCEEITQKKEDKITKTYIKELENKLESNLQDIRVLSKSTEKLNKVNDKLEEKIREMERTGGRVARKSLLNTSHSKKAKN